MFAQNRLILVAGVALVVLVGCSKHHDPTLIQRHQDPALQTALDELTRINSLVEAGVDYKTYSDRLLTAKGNVDVVLKQTGDDAAKTKIQSVFKFHLLARDAWSDNIGGTLSEVHKYWAKAAAATAIANAYAFADDAERREIDTREAARLKQEQQAEQERLAQEAAAVERQRAAEERQVAEAAERERIRRYAPDGTVYNLQPISVPIPDGLTTIDTGTELKVVKKNSNGTLHVQTDIAGGLECDVDPRIVSNDRDLVQKAIESNLNAQEQAARKRDQQNREFLQQKMYEDYRAGEAMTRVGEERNARPAPTPNPLDRGPYRSGGY
jgi:hypothetical protein